MENNKNNEKDQHKRKFTAAELDALTGSPTERVRSQKAGGDLGATGTNVSYEGPTSNSPVGTGYNSGQSGTGSDVSRDSDEDARTKASSPREKEQRDERESDDGEERNDETGKADTLGTP
ncbi:MAG: hypothetical protein EOP51_10755 [Sphingobacteriales bacterium]|nr:MAG: hypothetical protein EOP51_10755 [Sphingobacteriales bacterium]